jgi:type I restriction enzyme R subunit
MPHAYTEDQLVEQPAMGVFAELGWAVVCAPKPPPDARSRSGGTAASAVGASGAGGGD